MFNAYKYIVVGAGFFGATVAERIANDLQQPVLVIDKRDHLGGNSFSRVDATTGIEEHVYGSHVFHTSVPQVWEYIQRFTAFTEYQLRVFTKYKDQLYPLPVNLQTINKFYGRAFNTQEAQTFIAQEIAREKISRPSNLEEQAICLMGRPLYEAFIKEYTAKQWQTDPRNLPAETIKRLPVRYTPEHNYYTDICQGIPVDGYTAIFKRMLSNANLITVNLSTSFQKIRKYLDPKAKIIYTGAIDAFFNFQYGALGWRTLDFVRDVFTCDYYQPAAIINYAEIAIPYTRQHEFKHYRPDLPAQGTIVYTEYSRQCQHDEEPYYPINTPQDQALLAKYQKLALTECPNVIFGGRLGTYKYFDMDKTIAAALECYDTIKKSTLGNISYN